MIDIRSKVTGNWLDISPDTAFQVEYANPMFEDTHSPVPFSTDISFLPSETNKEEFGFLDAMMLAPANRKIDVELYASGVKIFDGCISYSGVKDGIINYSFAAKPAEDNWQGKICDKEIYRFSSGEAAQREEMADIRNGEVPGVYSPLISNATELSKPAVDGHDREIVFADLFAEKGIEISSAAVKYHNAGSDLPFTPVILVSKILEDELGQVDIGEGFDILADIAIIGQYKTDFAATGTGIPAEGLEIARALPDVTALDLIRIIAKTLCAALFLNGDRLSFKSVGWILQLTDADDWDDRISTEAELSLMPAGGYRFSFGNGDDENSYDDEGNVIYPSRTLKNMTDLFAVDEYRSAKCTATGDVVYSGTKTPEIEYCHTDRPPYVCVTIPTIPLIDITNVGMKEFDYKPEDSEGTEFDNSVGAKLVRCVPDHSHFATDYWLMSAIINPKTLGEERGDEVIMGVIRGKPGQYQLTDGRVHFEDDAEIAETDHSLELSPDRLFSNYHAVAAEWFRTEHQVVKTVVNLSATELAAFRMWNKVYFRGRRWIVKTLSVTFYADRDAIDTEGEFVSED